MHFLNQLLPEQERVHLAQDEAHSLREIDGTLGRLCVDMGESAVVDQKRIAFLLRLLRIHRAMKYILPVDARKKCIEVLLLITEKKALSSQVQCNLFTTVQTLISNSDVHIQGLLIDWKPLWKQAIGIATRESKHEATSPEQASLLKAVSKLLHTSRPYFTCDAKHSQAQKDAINDEIVHQAMNMIKDTRLGVCVEGVLLLNSCLPTNYNKYDEWLPQWVSIWTSVSHNAAWDYCWLALLSRARKHTNVNTTDWVSIWPLLKTKSAELMRFPAVDSTTASTGITGVGAGDFPHTFTGYYAYLLQVNNDVRKEALMKISKLMYFVMTLPQSSEQLAPAERITVTPPFGNAPAPEAQGSVTGAASSGALVGGPVRIPGFNVGVDKANGVSAKAVDMVLYLQSLRPFFYPSNEGHWTADLGFFFGAFIFQMCRHVGHGLAASVLCPPRPESSTNNNTHRRPKYQQPLDLATLRYLYGSCLSLIIECMYGKNQILAHFGSASLKNLFAIDPLLGEAVVPFLLQALDASAVNQSHQAPVAMRTLTQCFKSLLAPCPVIVPHLRSLLRLSLPGIDPSDVSKTGVTLGLYTAIFNWIPIGSKMTTSTCQRRTDSCYLTLVNCSDAQDMNAYKAELNTAFGGSILNPATLDAMLSELANFLVDEWVPTFLNNIFRVVDATEEKVKGSQPTPATGQIAQCMGSVFAALVPASQSGVTAVPTAEGKDIRAETENLVLAYVLKKQNINHAKVCAKLVETLLCEHPERLEDVLSQIFEIKDICSSCATEEGALCAVTAVCSTFSAEKLAFRLRLASGACRSSLSENIVLNDKCYALLSQIVNHSAIVFHSDKTVRKGCSKLLKDIFKGSASMYPYRVRSCQVDAGAGAAVVGSPTAVRPDASPVPIMQWHVPSGPALKRLCTLLRSSLGTSMQSVVQSVAAVNDDTTNNTSTAGESGAGSGNKTLEEAVQTNLHRVAKCLRGAAEILGDDMSADSLKDSSISSSNSSSVESLSALLEDEHDAIDAEDDIDRADDDDDDATAATATGRRSRILLSTGRTVIVQRALQLGEITAEEARYLREVRSDVMRFLCFVHDALMPKQSLAQQSRGESSVVLAAPTGIGAAAAATATASAPTVDMTNSALIRKAWIKSYVLCVTRRMAALKDGDGVRKYLKYVKRTSRSSLVKVMYKTIKHREDCLGEEQVGASAHAAGKGLQVLGTRAYWQGHDYTAAMISHFAWATHTRRCMELGHVAMRKNVAAPATAAGRDATAAGGSDGAQSDPFVGAFARLVKLCAHEYDVIRDKARHGFLKVAARYGGHLNAVIRTHLNSLLSPDTPYYTALAAATLCMETVSMKRITTHWELTQRMLTLMFASSTQQLINNVSPEAEKKEKIMGRVVDMFLRYHNSWCHLPLKKGQGVGVAAVIQNAMAAVASTSGAAAASVGAVEAAENAGLRIEIFAAYIIMHFIGHPCASGKDASSTVGMSPHSKDIQLLAPANIWHWAVTTIANCNGHPMQTIAYCALCRMSGGLYKATCSSPMDTMGCGSNRDELFDAVSPLRPLFNTASTWPGLLAGLSQQHSRTVGGGDDSGHGGGGSAESSAQWARGINSALRGAKGLAYSFNRRYSHPTGERSPFPSHVDTSSVGFLFSLIMAGVFNVNAFFSSTADAADITSTAEATTTTTTLSTLLSTASVLPSTSEQESRSNNIVRAEVFGASLRALLSLSAASISSVAQERGMAQLLSFLVNNTDKVSLDYCNDWAMAIFHAYSAHGANGSPGSSTSSGSKDAIVARILSDFRTSLKSNPAEESSSNSNSSNNSGSSISISGSSTDGFAAQSKALLLTSALLRGDIAAVAAQPPSSSSSSRSSSVAAALLAILMEYTGNNNGTGTVDVVCGYITSRLELASIFQALLLAESEGNSYSGEHSSNGQMLGAVCTQLCSEATAAHDESSSDDSVDSTGTVVSVAAAGVSASSIEITMTEDKDIVSTASTTAATTTTKSTTAAVTAAAIVSPAVQRSRNATELCCYWLRNMVSHLPMWRYTTYSTTANNNGVGANLLSQLLSVVILGCGSGEPTLAAKCQGTCFLACKRLSDYTATSPFHTTSVTQSSSSSSSSNSATGNTSTLWVSNEALFSIGTTFAANAKHTSYNIRKSVMMCLTALMSTHLQTLDTQCKKLFKDVFVAGMADAKVEVQALAMAGMVVYMTSKSNSELQKLATAYVSNSDILLAREKKRKKLLSKELGASARDNNTADKLDPMHQNTVMMMGTMILCAPYDMPSYMPALITSFVRHATVGPLTSTVARIVQAFKRTHQDRWEEYQKQLTREQLDDLQGAGAQHYFA